MADMEDTLAPQVTAEEAAAAAELDALIDGTESAPAPRERKPAAEPEADAEPERDYEAEALAMGWKPVEEFTGDPEKHRDAKTFVELADNDPAVLRKKYTEEVKKREEFEKRVTAATKAQVERLAQDAERQRREFEANIADLKRQRDEAVIYYAQNNGQAAAAQVAQQWDAHIQQEVARAPDMPDPTWVVEQQTSYHGWTAKSAYETDPVFKAAAFQIAELHKEKPPSQQFAEIDKLLSKRFPEYYGAAQPAQTSAPANGAPPPGSRTIDGARAIQTQPTSSFDKLPAEAKKMYQMLKAEGIAPDKAVFAKDYYDA